MRTGKNNDDEMNWKLKAAFVVLERWLDLEVGERKESCWKGFGVTLAITKKGLIF